MSTGSRTIAPENITIRNSLALLSPNLGLGVPDTEYIGPPGPGRDLDGSYGDDVLSGTRESDTIFGGTGGRDHIFGYGGNDTLTASLGTEGDYIYGGSGNDRIVGGEGGDYLFGGTGADYILGEADNGFGNDFIYGHDGNDTLNGGRGNDHIEGGNGNDEIIGANGADSLYGNAGEDQIDGGWDDDLIEGGDSNDLLIGGQGSDTIRGGNGDDTLYGVAYSEDTSPIAQVDVLTGGASADEFLLGDISGVFYQGEMFDGDGYADIRDFNRSQGDQLIMFGNANNYEFDFAAGSTTITYNGNLVAQVNGSIDSTVDVEYNPWS